MTLGQELAKPRQNKLDGLLRSQCSTFLVSKSEPTLFEGWVVIILFNKVECLALENILSLGRGLI
jgi:hypothetical protein